MKFVRKWLLSCCFLGLLTWAMPALAVDDPVNLDFRPDQPVSIDNVNAGRVQYLCEMHVSSDSDNTMLIKQIAGSSVVNGTSIQQGGSAYLTIRQLQSIKVILNGRSAMHLTNLGNFLIRATCFVS